MAAAEGCQAGSHEEAVSQKQVWLRRLPLFVLRDHHRRLIQSNSKRHVSKVGCLICHS